MRRSAKPWSVDHSMIAMKVASRPSGSALCSSMRSALTADRRATLVMRTVLVVGATGSVGRPVAQQLLSDGRRVRVLVRDHARAQHLLGDGVDYVVRLMQRSLITAVSGWLVLVALRVRTIASARETVPGENVSANA